MDKQQSLDKSIYHCAIIDACGNEITITESMIQQACEEFDKNYDNHFAAIVKPKAESNFADCTEAPETV